MRSGNYKPPWGKHNRPGRPNGGGRRAERGQVRRRSRRLPGMRLDRSVAAVAIAGPLFLALVLVAPGCPRAGPVPPATGAPGSSSARAPGGATGTAAGTANAERPKAGTLTAIELAGRSATLAPGDTLQLSVFGDDDARTDFTA